MIKLEDLYFLNEDEFKREDTCFLIQEVDKENKFIMDLDVSINENTFYKFFCKKSKSGKDEDNCKLRFLRFLNFPDGIYLEISDDFVKCHIFELKKSPTKKLNKISKQFLTARFHLISLFAILGIDMNKVKFFYYVGYVNDIELLEKVNLGSTKKVIPGRPMSHPKEIKDWLENKIEIKLGSQVFQEEIFKIQMDTMEQKEDEYQIFKKEFTIA